MSEDQNIIYNQLITKNMANVEFLIPIIVSLGVFAMVLGIKHFDSKVKMGMIEKGMNPETDKHVDKSKSLRHGFLFFGVGVGLIIAKFLSEFIFPDSDGIMLYFALGFLFGGVGLLLAHNKARKEDEANNL